MKKLSLSEILKESQEDVFMRKWGSSEGIKGTEEEVLDFIDDAIHVRGLVKVGDVTSILGNWAYGKVLTLQKDGKITIDPQTTVISMGKALPVNPGEFN